jgi:hypothetical protein
MGDEMLGRVFLSAVSGLMIAGAWAGLDLLLGDPIDGKLLTTVGVIYACGYFVGSRP